MPTATSAEAAVGLIAAVYAVGSGDESEPGVLSIVHDGDAYQRGRSRDMLLKRVEDPTLACGAGGAVLTPDVLAACWTIGYATRCCETSAAFERPIDVAAQNDAGSTASRDGAA